ncbi:coniferyl aldehyde dehydrogenase [Halomonas campisalis]|uniref:Aldehyde dehydrogenase n=1 Tax=Billgrantia campisalis TaxID=74661 RepID=A0ABS9P795_9GAMM|nr:coniferyl aldehyde dehydrogenase [Halomonas campisalis]MCG6656985.1 coniferyl aldehyde dehydrogenase [Halomonas campisalis]MDR5862172.1 coniferyl aldehyde dehydrogenase [Halomonas campisalis]
MNAPASSLRDHDVDSLQTLLSRQHEAYLADPVPDYSARIQDLKSLARMLKTHREEILQAISDDFGNRSRHETLLCEYTVVLSDIQHALKHLKRWMKPQRRAVDHNLYPGARNRVIPQPLGVIGVIVPWNFPLNLSLCPLVGIFAAGNRAMVKMSSNSSRLAALLARVSPDFFPEEKLAFVGDSKSGLGSAFSALPFDHLLFTGSSETGRRVMASAAANLTPVTLELGGKSPAIVADDFPLETSAGRLMQIKLLNAGQICTTVDYLFLPPDKVERFVELARELVAKRYPDLASDDYTSIIDEASYQRLWETVEDARLKGARVIRLSEGEGDERRRKFPPHILLDVTDDMLVMQREIFGPLLPIKTYRSIDEVIDYVASRPRPLALYPFTRDARLRDRLIERLISGGVSVNHCLMHVGQHELPFGGVGESGMGHYHGRDGFLNFSKLRPVYHQGPIDALGMLAPPYGKRADRILGLMQWLHRNLGK